MPKILFRKISWSKKSWAIALILLGSLIPERVNAAFCDIVLDSGLFYVYQDGGMIPELSEESELNLDQALDLLENVLAKKRCKVAPPTQSCEIKYQDGMFYISRATGAFSEWTRDRAQIKGWRDRLIKLGLCTAAPIGECGLDYLNGSYQVTRGGKPFPLDYFRTLDEALRVRRDWIEARVCTESKPRLECKKISDGKYQWIVMGARNFSTLKEGPAAKQEIDRIVNTLVREKICSAANIQSAQPSAPSDDSGAQSAQ